MKSAPSSPSELLENLRSLVAEAEKSLDNSFAEPAAETIEALRVRFVDAQKRLSDLCSTARHKVVAGAAKTDESIRAHPYAALGVAAATGLIVGVLVARRCQCNK